jgi:hypothetical protein
MKKQMRTERKTAPMFFKNPKPNKLPSLLQHNTKDYFTEDSCTKNRRTRHSSMAEMNLHIK